MHEKQQNYQSCGFKKKKVNFYAKHFSCFHVFFKFCMHPEIKPLKNSWKVLLLFSVIYSGKEICFVLFLNQKQAETLARIIYTRYVNLHVKQYF